ncbi:MAG: hypothetical protein U1E20_09350 [Methylocystis sp.]|uniref:hypothetical protein n=1 Tax=Methylocystis sp. TaxID=1911079 RepID=UPI0039637D9B
MLFQTNRNIRIYPSAAFAILIFAASASAQEATLDPALGTSGAKRLSAALLNAIKGGNLTAPAAPIKPRVTFSNAQYATGGVSLRNRQIGSIQVSGIEGPVKSAFLYWAYLFTSSPPSKQTITLCKPDAGSPATYSCSVQGGVLIGTGADTCWGSNGIAVYIANVTALVAGNGVYPVKLTNAASATNNGKDPWNYVQFPSAEGASLVVVGTGNQTVGIFDVGLAGATFFGSTAYTLSIPGGVIKTPVLWDSIGADGQFGSSRTVIGIAKEKTFINGIQIAGPGVDTTTNGITDSDWDGGSGWPLPQLWDDTGHSLPITAAPVGKLSLDVKVASDGATYDCLTPVVNVVSY